MAAPGGDDRNVLLMGLVVSVSIDSFGLHDRRGADDWRCGALVLCWLGTFSKEASCSLCVIVLPPDLDFGRSSVKDSGRREVLGITVGGLF